MRCRLQNRSNVILNESGAVVSVSSTCRTHGEMRSAEACTRLFGKREGKRPFGRPGLRMEDNVKIRLKQGSLTFVGRWATGKGIKFVAVTV
jgi:hypothetical protein